MSDKVSNDLERDNTINKSKIESLQRADGIMNEQLKLLTKNVLELSNMKQTVDSLVNGSSGSSGSGGSGGSGIASVEDDTTPQLGGNLDVNGKVITSVSNGNVEISPNGTGDIVLETNNQMNFSLGESNGSTPLPSGGSFGFTTRVGGYDQNNNGIQQAGNYTVYSGSTARIYSPYIQIGSASGWGTNQVNKTDNVNISSVGLISLMCDNVDFQQDINIIRALSINGNYGTSGQVLTSGGSGYAMTWTQAGDLQSWSGVNPQGFRSENEIDIMGGDIYVGNTGGEWKETAPGMPWSEDYWQWGYGYHQTSRNNGSNYTGKNEFQGNDVYISSTTPLNVQNYAGFMPSNQIRLQSMGTSGSQDHNQGYKPEILLLCDNGNSNTTDYPGLLQGGSIPHEAMFPKLTIHAGDWSTGTHTGSPQGKQNAGFLHMAAGHSAAVLSRRVYIGVSQSIFQNRNSPLGLTHNGYGREFNSPQSGGTYPNSFDPCDGQSYTEILSLSSKDIEIVSNNSVEFSNSIKVQGTFYNSDDRLKHNEQDLTNSLEIIRQLKPMKYQKTMEMKEADFNGTLTEGEYIIESGFIAQDIVNDIPELAYCVTGGDETKTVTNEEGIETQVSIEKPYSVNYNNIFTHNVAATQELDTIVTNLLAKISTLEARITELENK